MFVVSMVAVSVTNFAQLVERATHGRLSDHEATRLRMKSLNLPLGSVQMRPSRTLQSKDGNHLRLRTWILKLESTSKSSVMCQVTHDELVRILADKLVDNHGQFYW